VAQDTVRPFTSRQIELVEIFGSQALIAIENTRLFEAEQASKRELQESLEYQTAISEVLAVISRSPNELKPVVETIAKTARRLCDATRASVMEFKDVQFVLIAHDDPGVAGGLVQHLSQTPIKVERGNLPGRVALEQRTIQIPDIRSDPEYMLFVDKERDERRSMLCAPLMRKGELVGVIVMSRNEVRPFSQRQIELVETFADQAVIAIENARLFEAEQTRTCELTERTHELTEALEYQTATSDVLAVISRSKFDLQPTLDAIAGTASRLCGAADVTIFLREGGDLRSTAHHGHMSMAFPYVRQPIGRDWVAGRTVIDRKPIHVHDLFTAGEDLSRGREIAALAGHRTTLGIPLLREGAAIGCMVLRRTVVHPFAEKQITILQTFANQAVIAIENTRLFEEVQTRTGELGQALEYQTAISDVLGVIGRSKFDLQPVLTAIVSTACRLCEAPDASIALRRGDWLEFAAGHGSAWINNEWIKDEKLPIEPGLVAGRAILERRPIHIGDVATAGDDFARSRELAIARGQRTTVAVPLLREEEAIGCLFLRRIEVRPFSDKHVSLLETFADQAVIAIENVRLFEEIARKSRELEIASQHKSRFVANMSHELRTPLAAILGYAELMQEGFYEPLGQKSLDALTRIRSNGNHLLGLINTVLDIAKIESGQFTLNMSEYAIESVVETVRSATESLAQNKKLALKTEVAKSLPIGLGDEQRLTQVLLNLVGNAIKFTDTGEVRVTAKAVNGHFNVSVTDTGPGIPDRERTRIFDLFHQVDSSLTKAKGGTGLGLAIAKQIVEMHGGRIWVESILGMGSTFQMEIPTRAEFQRQAL